MIEQDDAAASLRDRNSETGRKLAWMPGMAVKMGRRQIRFGGVNGDRQNAARRQFENGAAILAESVLRGQTRFQPSGGARLEAKGRSSLRRRVSSSKRRVATGAPPKCTTTGTERGIAP